MNNLTSEQFDVISKLYEQNVADIKKGLYGEYIETNDDGTFKVVDKILCKTLKIIGDTVLWKKCGFELYGEWLESIPIISIKDRRYEQKFFENRTQMLSYDGIFESPDYFYNEKNKVARIKYLTPMQYIQRVAIGFKKSLEYELARMDKERVIKYAADMLKGDLFPMINIEYYKNSSIDQEGRHRAMAVQYLIDTKEIPEDTLIPVVIVTEV